MKKALMLANVISMIEHFNMDNICILQEKGYEVHIACNMENNDWSIERVEQFNKKLDEMGIKTHTIDFSRNPSDIGKVINSYRQVQKLLNEEEFSLIHCHAPIASAITRLAAREARKKNTKVIYTAHGFPFCKNSPITNWILYYPIERWLARYTDVLITINQEDYKRAQKFKAKKVYYIPGVGIDTKKFCLLSDSEKEVRKKLGLDEESIVLLSVGELNSRKNHKVILEALALLKSTDFFSRIQYIVCGTGKQESELKEKTRVQGLEEHVHFLGFRDDISEICNCSDIFIFPSLSEGLPVALMEAMASGLPVICSNVRGNTDLIENGVSGYIVENEAYAYAQKIRELVESEDLRILFGSNAKEKIRTLDIENIRNDMTMVYENIGFKDSGELRGGGLKGLYKIEMRQKLRKFYHIPQEAIVLLSVGEISKRKNHEVIIHALEKLHDPRFWLVICGNGALAQHYRKLAEELKIEEHLIFTGFVKNVEDYYYIADIFIFPSLLEGLGLAAIEAMAAGLPLLTSDIQGINDYSINGVTGFSCAPNDSEKFAEYITKLAGDRVLRETLGKYNQEVSGKYDICNINRLMEDIYQAAEEM